MNGTNNIVKFVMKGVSIPSLSLVRVVLIAMQSSSIEQVPGQKKRSKMLEVKMYK
jgi:hypothetical protein